MMDATLAVSPAISEKRLNPFERYLTIWVGLCMVAGVLLGRWVVEPVHLLRGWELGQRSHINAPFAILIWLMIIPMMMEVDFAAIRLVGTRPKGLLVTLVINWVVKPFSMAFFAWLFFRYLFSAWIGPTDADQYIAGCIILAAAPCTAMVFVWSYLTDGDLAGERFEVFSAGTHPVGLNPGCVEAMAEVGIDIAHHRSKSVVTFTGKPFDYVITVCDHAKENCPMWSGARHLVHWSFDDPAAETDPIHRRRIFGRVRDEIAVQVRQFVRETSRGESLTP